MDSASAFFVFFLQLICCNGDPEDIKKWSLGVALMAKTGTLGGGGGVDEEKGWRTEARLWSYCNFLQWEKSDLLSHSVSHVPYFVDYAHVTYSITFISGQLVVQSRGFGLSAWAMKFTTVVWPSRLSSHDDLCPDPSCDKEWQDGEVLILSFLLYLFAGLFP